MARDSRLVGENVWFWRRQKGKRAQRVHVRIMAIRDGLALVQMADLKTTEVKLARLEPLSALPAVAHR